MHFSSHKALSLLFFAAPGLFTPLQQSPLQLPCYSEVDTISGIDQTTEPHFGYQGPGVYHLLGSADRYQLSLGIDGSGDGYPAIVWKANETARQLWFISDVGGGYVTIASNDTGVLLTATGSSSKVGTYFKSPANPGSRWRFSNYSASGNTDNAVRLSSANYPTEVLAVYERIQNVNGTEVYNWPSQGQYLNEAWLPHYMGAS